MKYNLTYFYKRFSLIELLSEVYELVEPIRCNLSTITTIHLKANVALILKNKNK